MAACSDCKKRSNLIVENLNNGINLFENLKFIRESIKISIMAKNQNGERKIGFFSFIITNHNSNRLQWLAPISDGVDIPFDKVTLVTSKDIDIFCNCDVDDDMNEGLAKL